MGMRQKLAVTTAMLAAGALTLTGCGGSSTPPARRRLQASPTTLALWFLTFRTRIWRT